MSSSGVALQKFLIPLEEIHLATQNFSPKTQIGDGGYGVVYRGQLSERWQNRTAAIKRLNNNAYQGEHEFFNELEMFTRFHHANIDRFIGYCDEGNEMIIASEYAINGSLDHHLQDPNKMRCITWSQRLKICVGAARGLNYLHSGLGDDKCVIHRNVKSANILLDDNMEAGIICGFDLSVMGPRYQPHTQRYTGVAGTQYYLDPVYLESGILKTESDVYSFGVVMFEMLSGRLAYHERSIGDDKPGPLINLVRRYYEEGLEKLIDPDIRDQVDRRSFLMFKDIAYKCINLNSKERPTMDRVIIRIEEALDLHMQGSVPSQKFQESMFSSDVNLESFLIPLEEIKLATKNFSLETRIGNGGFGVVYRGHLSNRWQNRTAAIKCLRRPGSYQGEHEFRNELEMISSFNHQNIIPFIGYCDEGDNMIIVYEYASNCSLDHHLQDPERRGNLTWAQRLKICIGAANGLNYLHTGLGEKSRVIHRDVKSGNILLDDNLEAKISDFGLSRLGPRNQPHTQIYTYAAGTNFYMDPIYLESGILRKESDVYSFGVVLFEMLTGMLAYCRKSFEVGANPQPLINLVRRYYDDRLDILIDPHIKDQIDGRSFYTFTDIAYQCISYNLRERPTLDTIIQRIEETMDFQQSRGSTIEG